MEKDVIGAKHCFDLAFVRFHIIFQFKQHILAAALSYFGQCLELRGDLRVHVGRASVPEERGLTACCLHVFLLNCGHRAAEVVLIAAELLQIGAHTALVALLPSWPHGMAVLLIPAVSGGLVVLHGHLREKPRRQEHLLRLPGHVHAAARLPVPQLVHLHLFTSVLAPDPV